MASLSLIELIRNFVPSARDIIDRSWFRDTLSRILKEETDKEKIADLIIEALEDNKVFPNGDEKDKLRKEMRYASSIYLK